MKTMTSLKKILKKKAIKRKIIKALKFKKNLRKKGIKLKNNFRNNKNFTNKGFIKILRSKKYKSNLSSCFYYFTLTILLSFISCEGFAVDLAKFGKGVTEPMVKFAEDYWIYGAGIGGITTALFSDGDGRTRVIRGGTVFLGASAICMGILAAMK